MCHSFCEQLNNQYVRISIFYNLIHKYFCFNNPILYKIIEWKSFGQLPVLEFSQAALMVSVFYLGTTTTTLAPGKLFLLQTI